MRPLVTLTRLFLIRFEFFAGLILHYKHGLLSFAWVCLFGVDCATALL